MKRCGVTGCPEPHRAKGYCYNHYRVWRRNGRATPDLEERFWSKVDTTGGPDACWLWQGALTRGYGRYHVPGTSHGSVLAHRYAWELVSGQPPAADRFLCHHCDNPPCVNPAHLFEGSHLDNMRDMVAKNRHRLHRQKPA